MLDITKRCCKDSAKRKQEKLRLDMDDEAAVEWMQQLLNESATALMPQIMETTHKVCWPLTRAVDITMC